MVERKPTRDAQKRFETLEGMLDATILLPREKGELSEELTGTVVDISVGCMCLRIPMKQSNATLVREAVDGDYIEVHVSDSPQRQWTIMGHLAWVWAPPVEDTSLVGSFGVDIAGVIEDDERWIGKVRDLFTRKQEVAVDRGRRSIESPARRRAKNAPSLKEEDTGSNEEDLGSNEEEDNTDGETS